MDEIEPIALVTVSKLAEVLPMGPHDLLVVVLDKCLEDLRLLWIACVDLGEKSVDQEPVHDHCRLLFPDRIARDVQSMPIAQLDLIHEQLSGYRIHLQKKRDSHSQHSMLFRQNCHVC